MKQTAGAATSAIIAAWCIAGVTTVAISAQPRTRTVYVTATDQQGAPVLDLVAGEFRVKEGGRDRVVARLEPATERLHISLIVDDNGTGIFRSAVAQFVQRLRGEADFAISVVTGQALKLVDYTADLNRLTTAVNYLAARPATPDGGQLLGAIYEAARELHKREAARPVIVAMTVGGDEHNPMPAHHVLNQLRDSRASLNVFEMTNSLLRPTTPVARASQLLEESINISEVLGDGSRQTGGRKNELVAATGSVPGMRRLAEELAHQYRVSYVVPDGEKPHERLEVSVTRADVTLRAPTRVSIR